MAKTDRQTDKNSTHTWWSVTGFNDEIAMLESPEAFPNWLCRVYGGREECPKTKTLHFQGALQCNWAVRMSQVKKWLPTAHLEPARKQWALEKYAMKAETSVGDKVVRENQVEYWSMQRTLCEIGKIAVQYNEREFDVTQRFWMAAKHLLRRDPRRTSSLANPAVLNMWKNTYEVWEDEKTRALVLQPESDGDASPESEE